MRDDRWSTPDEIMQALTCETPTAAAGGPVLFSQNGRNWVYTGEGHQIFLGVSGSGKTRRGTLPLARSVLEAGENLIDNDPKGDGYRELGALAKAKGYRVRVINFRNIYESTCWNPLEMPAELYRSGILENKQVAMEMVDELAHVLYPSCDKADPFWIDSARSVFIGAVMILLEQADPEQITIASIHHLIAKGDERFGGSTYLKTFLDNQPDNSVAARLLRSYVTAPNDTKASIRSVFLEGISMFTRSEGLQEMLGRDDLHINSLDGEEKTAIFIVMPDENAIYDGLCGCLCSQLMSHYIRLAQDRYNGRLPRRVNICLEELGNIGKSISNLPHLMSAGRSRNLRISMVLQSLSQLVDIYGASNATTITSNADVIIAYRTNHWDTLQELSRKCGDRRVEYGSGVTREPLISPSQLAAMKTGQALVMVSGFLKFITWLPDYTQLYDTSEWQSPERHIRKRTPAPACFDLAGLVKNEQRKRLSESLSAASSKATKAPPEPFMFSALIGDEDDDCETGEFELRILFTGGNRTAVARAIAANTSLSVADANRKLQNLPASIFFPDRAAAEKADKAISAAGGMCVIRKV